MQIARSAIGDNSPISSPHSSEHLSRAAAYSAALHSCAAIQPFGSGPPSQDLLDMLAQRGRQQADGIGRFGRSRDRTHRFEAAGGVMIDFRDDFEGCNLRTIDRYINDGRTED